MPIIDIQLLVRKVKFIQEDLTKLKNFEGLSLAEFLKNEEKRMIAERLLEKIVGRIIDINYHILKEEYEILPEDYYDSFIQIGYKKVIPQDLAEEMAKSTGLRNALAHEYDEVDSKMVYEAIFKATSEVPRYLAKINAFLES